MKRNNEYDYSKLQYVAKLTVSGNCFEWQEFEIFPRNPVRRKPRETRSREERIADYLTSGNNTKNHKATSRNIERLIRCNPSLVKFLTLTFEKNITDIDIANKHFHNFIPRLLRTYKNFQYICVPEFQKRGAVHYHLLCNLPFIENDELEKIWQHGFTKIKKTERVKNIASYMTKYITKDIFDGRLFGKKKFFCSQSLIRPQIYYDDDALRVLNSQTAIDLIYDNKYSNGFRGESIYRLYQKPEEPNSDKTNNNQDIS